MLELSLREALALGHNYIGTEHILLGLLREGEGVGAQVLVQMGADLPRVRARVLEIVAEHPESEDVATLRRDYETEGLERADLAGDPITQFKRWYDDASRFGLEEPNAMTLATVTPDGTPDARIVLLRGVDERGFVWFTNRTSPKGRELAANPRAALVFVWLPLHRQVRVTGTVSQIDDSESDAYFATRPRESQLGAWASVQSEVLPERSFLDEAVAEIDERYRDLSVPRPPHWGGYRLAHETLEVWQGRANRLHDRFRFSRRGRRLDDRTALALGPGALDPGRRGGGQALDQRDGAGARVPGLPSPSRSGCRPRTRGGSSSCTPPPAAGSPGSPDASPRRANGIESRSVAIV